jgi:hypothetical protein
MKRWLILLTVGCLVFGGVANAAVQQGDTEVDLSGSWLYANGYHAVVVGAGLGYFVSDNIQLRGGVTGVWSTGADGIDDEDDTGDHYAIVGAAKYHFTPTNQWVPYAGGFAGLSWWGGGDSEWTYGPLAGLRYELNANNDFQVEYQYQLYSGGGDGLHALLFGIVHQFK